MRNFLAPPPLGNILYWHRAHLNTLQQGPRHLPDNQNNQLKLHLQALNAIITACDFKPVNIHQGSFLSQTSTHRSVRKHIDNQTGPLQEPQTRMFVETREKIFFNSQPKHHPVQHQPYQTSEASPGGFRPLGESPRNKSRRNSNTVASSRWSRGSSTDKINPPSGVFPCQGFSWNSNHAFVPRPVGLCFIAARWGGR